MSGFEVTITGIADVNRLLAQIAPNEAKNLMRATVHGLAVDLVKDVRPRMPKLSGDMAAATGAKRERGTRTQIASTVRVSAKGFQWRFLEYGDGPDKVEHAMFLKTLEALRPDLDRRYLEVFVSKLVARLTRLKKKAG